ncbi:MAG: DUF952 domain-containing protein, partial [Motiliproteus sp.]
MSNLYRVITEAAWTDAQKHHYVARCGNDQKADRTHLNLREAVESIAAAYFDPKEKPLVLEIDISGFSDRIEWLEPTGNNGWKQPLADIPNIPVSAVIRVLRLLHTRADDDGNVFTLALFALRIDKLLSHCFGNE